MMFERLRLGGKDLTDEQARVVLDVVGEYAIANPDMLHGTGRRNYSVSRARQEVWHRMTLLGYKQSEIADLFGVTRAAVNIALKRYVPTETGNCPCCGRPITPALMRG